MQRILLTLLAHAVGLRPGIGWPLPSLPSTRVTASAESGQTVVVEVVTDILMLTMTIAWPSLWCMPASIRDHYALVGCSGVHMLHKC